MADYNSDSTGDIPYDLRQIYAMLVGKHMEDITILRKQHKFYDWYKSLEDLKTITFHKFRKKDEAIKTYNQLVERINELAKKNVSVWNGTNKNSNVSSEFDKVLRELEEFLYQKMEEGKLFGEGYRIPGL